MPDDTPPPIFGILADTLTPVSCDDPQSCGSDWESVGGSVVECTRCGGQGIFEAKAPDETRRRALQ